MDKAVSVAVSDEVLDALLSARNLPQFTGADLGEVLWHLIRAGLHVYGVE